MYMLWFRVDPFAEMTAMAAFHTPDADIDDHLEPEVGHPTNRSVRVGRSTGFCAQVARELKISFPYITLRPTTADYLSVQRAAQLLMTQHGMRPTHIKKHIHLVVASVFVPSKDEMMAVGVMQSQVNGDLRRGFLMSTASSFLAGVFGDHGRYPLRRD